MTGQGGTVVHLADVQGAPLVPDLAAKTKKTGRLAWSRVPADCDLPAGFTAIRHGETLTFLPGSHLTGARPGFHLLAGSGAPELAAEITAGDMWDLLQEIELQGGLGGQPGGRPAGRLAACCTRTGDDD